MLVTQCPFGGVNEVPEGVRSRSQRTGAGTDGVTGSSFGGITMVIPVPDGASLCNGISTASDHALGRHPAPTNKSTVESGRMRENSGDILLVHPLRVFFWGCGDCLNEPYTNRRVSPQH